MISLSQGRLSLKQWNCSKATIEWFDRITDKSNCRFIQFDIVEFYPSISKGLLLQALEFGRNYSTITDTDVAVIMNARKSLLFYNDSFWVKRQGEELFDVAMGSFDGAEIADLVGLFILHILNWERISQGNSAKSWINASR